MVVSDGYLSFLVFLSLSGWLAGWLPLAVSPSVSLARAREWNGMRSTLVVLLCFDCAVSFGLIYLMR